MRVLLAGATGALGRALIPRLITAGHDVTALSRSTASRVDVERAGAVLAVADLLEGDQILAVARTARPDAVIHAAKAIPKRGPMTYRDMRGTDMLHREGTRNLVAAALAAGATRLVAESIVFAYGYADHGSRPLHEADSPRRSRTRAAEWLASGVRDMEAITLHTDGLDGIALRCGLFYGPGAGTDTMAKMLRRRLLPVPHAPNALWPMIHVHDAADAVVAALTRGQPGAAYNLVDDEPVAPQEFLAELARVDGAPAPTRLPTPLVRVVAPYYAEFARVRLAATNVAARRELKWEPRYRSYREGLAAWASAAESPFR